MGDQTFGLQQTIGHQGKDIRGLSVHCPIHYSRAEKGAERHRSRAQEAQPDDSRVFSQLEIGFAVAESAESEEVGKDGAFCNSANPRTA